jgi:hypothetical protein
MVNFPPSPLTIGGIEISSSQEPTYKIINKCFIHIEGVLNKNRQKEKNIINKERGKNQENIYRTSTIFHPLTLSGSGNN